MQMMPKVDPMLLQVVHFLIASNPIPDHFIFVSTVKVEICLFLFAVNRAN